MTFSSPIPKNVFRIAPSGIVPLVLGLWSTWAWYYSRLIDNSDEPLGAIALATCLALGLARRAEPVGIDSVQNQTPPALLPILLALYCISLLFAPHMVSALLAVTIAVTGLQNARLIGRLYPGDWCLLLLSLPVIASLNFYIGYPMRLAAGAISSTLLNINGFQVIAQGTSLLWDGRIVDIDAPCSGIKMLWMAAYIAAALTTVMRMDWRRSCTLAGTAFLATIFTNAIRVSSLFYLETGVLPVAPAWHDTFHEGIGVASFLMLGAALSAMAFWLAARHNNSGQHYTGASGVPNPLTAVTSIESHDGNPDAVESVRSKGQLGTSKKAADNSKGSRHAAEMQTLSAAAPTNTLVNLPNYTRFTMALCLVAAVLPLISSAHPTFTSKTGDGFPGWPQSLDGTPLTPLPMSSVNKKFLSNFPGRVALFANGNRKVVYRWLKQPTRQLHPAADCYKAAGYKIKWLPQEKSDHHVSWSTFQASKDKQRLYVRERIYDEHNHTWVDVSDWYWSTLSSRSSGPWWAVCTYEPVNGN